MSRVPPSFGPLLRRWRQSRGISQERLAEDSEVSPRHISFLETGRSSPSREMVLILASALDLPLRERNAMLNAAGFAPVYSAFSLDDPAMEPVRSTIDRILRAHEPHGAVVVDRGWNLVQTNRGALRLLEAFADPSAATPIVAQNLVHAILHPAYLRPSIVNWSEVAGAIVERLRRDALLDPIADSLVRAVSDYPDVANARPAVDAPPAVALDVHLRRGAIDARYFTTLTTLGTPLDVTAQELRIESYFPADDATDAWMRS